MFTLTRPLGQDVKEEMFQRLALRETLFRIPTPRFPGSLLKLRKLPDGALVPQDIIVWTTPVEAGAVVSQTIT